MLIWKQKHRINRGLRCDGQGCNRLPSELSILPHVIVLIEDSKSWRDTSFRTVTEKNEYHPLSHLLDTDFKLYRHF